MRSWLNRNPPDKFIAEASQKLSEAVQGKTNKLQCAKVTQAMLSAETEKLNARTKQLADIEEKLKKLQHTVVNKMTDGSVVVLHDTLDPAAMKRKLQ